MRVVAAALLMLSLNACAIPPMLSFGKLAADGVLYASTGKTSTDHGLSMATGKDCATLRVLEREDVCQETVLSQSEPVPAEVARDRVALDSLALTIPADPAIRRAMADQALDRAFQPHAGAVRPAAQLELAVLPRPIEPSVLRVAARRAPVEPAQVAHASSGRAVIARPGLIKVASGSPKSAVTKVSTRSQAAEPQPAAAPPPEAVAAPVLPERASAMERLSQILKKAFRIARSE